MDRLPPGQRWVVDVPVLHHGDVPHIDTRDWRLALRGLVENPVEIGWEEFISLPKTKVVRDWHCVTRWSVMDVEWEGVPFSEVAALASPLKEARFVMIHCYGGYSTNLPLSVVLSDDVLFALRMNGSPLTPEHGSPVRLVVPSRYAWKSAKWVSGVEFMAHDRPGFWEKRGYHNDGDPWLEQRFSP